MYAKVCNVSTMMYVYIHTSYICTLYIPLMYSMYVNVHNQSSLSYTHTQLVLPYLARWPLHSVARGGKSLIGWRIVWWWTVSPGAYTVGRVTGKIQQGSRQAGWRLIREKDSILGTGGSGSAQIWYINVNRIWSLSAADVHHLERWWSHIESWKQVVSVVFCKSDFSTDRRSEFEEETWTLKRHIKHISEELERVCV